MELFITKSTASNMRVGDFIRARLASRNHNARAQVIRALNEDAPTGRQQ